MSIEKLNAELAAIPTPELVEKARNWISDLCKSGASKWSLRVPPDPQRDPDLIFGELCRRLEAPQVRQGVKKLEWHTDAVGRQCAILIFGVEAFVFQTHDGWFWNNEDCAQNGPYETEAGAKAAAQRRYDDLIRSELEPASALQPTQYLLAETDQFRYTVDLDEKWIVCADRIQMSEGGEFDLFLPALEFSTPEEAAECFWGHFPHLKPQQ